MARIVGLSLVGVRWRTDVQGEFFCPDCGGDRNYRRQHASRWFGRWSADAPPQRLQCATCGGCFGLDALAVPTAATLGLLLRNATWAIVLAVLAAGGSTSPLARHLALATLAQAGHRDPDETRMLSALAVLTDDSPLDDVYGCGSALAVELHTALEPLAPHLHPAGRERLLLLAAWVALADGPYRTAEREALTAIGTCLTLTPDTITTTLEAAAHTPQP